MIISPKKILVFQLIVLLFLVILHTVGILTGFSSLFNVGVINSIPSWYSSFNLLISSVLLGLISLSNNQKVNKYFWHWLGLSIFFLYLSMDEFAEIHEKVDHILELLPLPELRGIFRFQWVVVGIPIVIIIFFIYLKFIKHLPKTTKYLVIFSGFIFVGGALGFEMLSAWRYDVVISNSDFDPIFIILTTAEELCEMIGVIFFMYALLNYISVYLQGIKISIGEQTIVIK